MRDKWGFDGEAYDSWKTAGPEEGPTCGSCGIEDDLEMGECVYCREFARVTMARKVGFLRYGDMDEILGSLIQLHEQRIKWTDLNEKEREALLLLAEKGIELAKEKGAWS